MIARRRLLTGLAAAAVAAPAAAAPYRAPRNAYGAPDLDGTWTNASGTTLERPRAFKSLVISQAEADAYERSQRGVVHGVPGDDVGQGDAEWFQPDPPLARIRGEARTSWIVDPPDGRLPYSAEGRRALGAQLGAMRRFDGPEIRPTAERCLVGFGGPVGAPMLNAPQTHNAYQFVQTRDYLVARAETNSDTRVVSLDGSAPASGLGHPWLGVSRGRWEGETLVVETTRFNPGESLRSLPFMLYMSPDAGVVERLTRVSPGEIFYEFTVDDPAVFTRPWRGEMMFRSLKAPLYEYACHEGNYSLANILSGARATERQASAAAR